MLDKIDKIDPPDWLMSNEFKFDHLNVIKDSLFFPQSALNIYPINVFFENVYSFIFTDFGIERSRFLDVISKYAFIDFNIIHHSQLLHSDFDYHKIEDIFGEYYSFFDIENHPFRNYVQESSFSKISKMKHETYFDWLIFENSAGKRFSFLYISAEPIAVYFALYSLLDQAPKIVVLDNLARRMFQDWVMYANECDLFARILLNCEPEAVKKNKHTPEYLAKTEAVDDWESYPHLVCDIDSYFSLWQRGENLRSTYLEEELE
jgi:hypothetical protein